MKFAVGYQLAEPGEESFADLVAAYRAHIAEVYFAWVGQPSGRSPVGGRDRIDPDAERRMVTDLQGLHEMGITLDLLFNANCYGDRALSRELECEVRRTLERVQDIVGKVDVVTTTSPAIAHMVGDYDSHIERRASVNMRIGTVEGMRYLGDCFESFHVQRDYNRDMEHLGTLKTWADAHGKRLYMLVNSGCLRFCSGQTFHDNLVAHETGVAACENIESFLPYTCWRFLKDRSNWPAILQATWVRPEDLHRYDELFPVVKLATRMHERPHIVMRAYAERRFNGNLLDLLEPGFSPLLAPYVIDNTRFPEDWSDRSSGCSDTWDYCESVLQQVLRRVEFPEH